MAAVVRHRRGHEIVVRLRQHRHDGVGHRRGSVQHIAADRLPQRGIGDHEEVGLRCEVSEGAGQPEESLAEVFDRRGHAQRRRDRSADGIAVVRHVEVRDPADRAHAPVGDSEGIQQQFPGIHHTVGVQVQVSFDDDLFAVGQAGDLKRQHPAVGVAGRGGSDAQRRAADGARNPDQAQDHGQYTSSHRFFFNEWQLAVLPESAPKVQNLAGFVPVPPSFAFIRAGAGPGKLGAAVFSPSPLPWRRAPRLPRR